MRQCRLFQAIFPNVFVILFLALSSCLPAKRVGGQADTTNRNDSAVDEIPKVDGPADETPGFDDLHARVVEVEIGAGKMMKFCWIPPGQSKLGSTAAERRKITRWDDSIILPEDEAQENRGTFTSSGFWLGKYVVTQEQWQLLMGDNPSRFVPSEEEIRKAGITDTTRFPVERVSWNHFADFLKKLNQTAKVPEAMGKGQFCLPHENEWEYACRGGRGTGWAFYFGNSLNGTQANCNGSRPFGTSVDGPSLKRTCEVGSYEKVAPHPWGLCDMHGNVAQWCSNTFSKRWDSPVVRGGSWHSPAWSCRSAFRDWKGVICDVSHIGFRLCFRPE